MADMKENFEKLKQLVDIARGHKDVKSRVAVLANPENPLTMSILSKEEAHFISVTDFITQSKHWGGMFQPMHEFASSRLSPNISIGGKGREQTIQFVAAMSEAKALQKLENKKIKESE